MRDQSRDLTDAVSASRSPGAQRPKPGPFQEAKVAHETFYSLGLTPLLVFKKEQSFCMIKKCLHNFKKFLGCYWGGVQGFLRFDGSLSPPVF